MGRKRKDPERGFDRKCERCGVPFIAANTFVGRFCTHACYGLHLRERPASSLEERFWANVQKGDECWEWTGAVRDTGYGVIWVREVQKQLKAHRVSWEMHFGPIPASIFVCHHCDNRRCVRPDHLFLGTRTDNADDMKKKGRQSRGEGRWKAKLTADDVVAIRAAYRGGETTLATLGARYGVTGGAIYEVVTRQNWRHIP